MTSFYTKNVQMYFDSNGWGHFSFPVSSNQTRHTQYAPETRLYYVKWHIWRSGFNSTGSSPRAPSSMIIDHESKSMIEESYSIILLLIQLLLVLILINITIITWKKYANYQKHYKNVEHLQLQNNKSRTNHHQTVTQVEPYYYEVVDIPEQ